MLRSGARTPEELETLFEDAFVVGDAAALPELFEDGGLLAAGQAVCGREAVGPFAAVLWERDVGYVAEPRRVLQARDTALVVSERSIGVMRRASDGRWRYAIALLDVDDTTNEEER
jgi:hypothetical protein